MDPLSYTACGGQAGVTECGTVLHQESAHPQPELSYVQRHLHCLSHNSYKTFYAVHARTHTIVPTHAHTHSHTNTHMLTHPLIPHPRALTLLYNQTVAERHDLQHLQQSCFGGPHLGALFDEVHIILQEEGGYDQSRTR